MRILAIDPGTYESAYVIYENGEPLRVFGKIKNEEFYQKVMLPSLNCYDVIVIEMIRSQGMPVGKEVFETCLWIGKFMQRGEDLKREVKLVYRHDIKIFLCGSSRAKDSNIRQAIIDRLGVPGTKKSPGWTYGVSGDVWAALAVAIFTSNKLTKNEEK